MKNYKLRIQILKIVISTFFLFCLSNVATAQLKFIIEDFEGFSDGTADLKANGIFTYGNIKANIDYRIDTQHPGAYAGERVLRLNRVAGKTNFGGWGKGLSLNVELDPTKDHLNFYIYTTDTNTFKIELQEDDNGDNTYEKEQDDSWVNIQKLHKKNSWELISIPLNKFRDSNKGGDGVFNINYRQGKLLCLIISFANHQGFPEQTWSFDFICFSQGKLSTGPNLFDAPAGTQSALAGCSLGAWSKEGNSANFAEIASNFENIFKYGSKKKLGVVHFFQPFAFEGKNLYPSVERISKVVLQGYIPMITLEDHFVNQPAGQRGTIPNMKQPNLYSIIEGHFDSFFTDWAKQIKQVDGIVLLRILHEFNGDWYPWCIVNNDKNPELLIKAFRHIHAIFKTQDVTNVRFIWCPNSVSYPQEKWNFILEAYPGDEYVDFVGLDIYNGAGKSLLWRSFRKEGIENYFILTQNFPDKPIFVCETASRERKTTEPKAAQDKAGWIRQTSEALTSDMSKIKLLTWFNEKESFKISSSINSQGAYLDYILKNDYFKSGTKYLYPLLKQ